MTTTPVRAADGDLAANAATGDAGAYAHLYHRHIESAWRLAQATASSPDDAARATTGGFVATVRLVGRGRDDVADQFRLHLLAAVYREAQAQRDRPPSGGPARRGAVAIAPSAAGPRLVAAFAHLPARWRAALWLQEVEGLSASAAGQVLGVSSAAAVQLKKRGLASLEHRVLAAGGSLPLADLAGALAVTLAPLPPDVQTRTEAQWKRAVARDRRRSGLASGWLMERAPGPLAVFAGVLCAVGIIGLGLVGRGSTVNHLSPAGPVTFGAPAGAGGAGTANLGGGTAGVAGAAAGASASAGQNGGTAAGTSGGASTSTATGSAAAQGPQLIAVQPSTTPVSVTVPTVPVNTTVPTTPPTTAPPVTTPPVTTPPVTTPPVTTPTTTPPLLQVSLNANPLAVVNVGLGQGGCTGVKLLSIKLGCTTAPAGLTLGGTLLGGK